MQKRPTIALAMIVKNEEHNLPTLFESIKDCFDEIHITDTGSTDKTVQICKDFGAIVHHFDWINDFGAARNASFEPVKTDYIMWLDADDSLDGREEFLKWRDNVMTLADYWLATYNYSSLPDGTPVCSFSRERVIKRKKNLKWEYFIHEGIIPKPMGEIVCQFTKAWKVKHRRTAEDLAKDKNRNIGLFMNNKDKMDARMQFYYGKELFEVGRLYEAIEELGKALLDRKLESHDRTLATQYLGYAFFLSDKLEKAKGIGLTGVQLSPNRAEFYVLIADSFVKQNNFKDAIPFYAAAKSCLLDNSQHSFTPIFSNAENYTFYPRNQLARCYNALGGDDLAIKEVDECLEKYPNKDSQAIKDDLMKVRSIVNFSTAKKSDDIVILGLPHGPYTWDPDIYKVKSMGGSETAAIEMAYWLNKLSGRKVKVFNNRNDVKSYGDVTYLPCGVANEWFRDNKPYFNINWRHNMKITDAPTFLWCHDLMTPGAEFSNNYVKHLCLTPFHKNYVMTMQGIPEDKILVTRNGVVPERFEPIQDVRDPNKFIFSSSPDRGLDRAMIVMDSVVKKYPDIKLHIFYGIEHLPMYGHQVLFEKLKKMIAERSYVIYHGATQQQVLMNEFKTSAYCVQPSDWIETSMISALERVFCGVYQTIRGVGGCIDTLGPFAKENMAQLIYNDCITPDDYQVYIDATIKAYEEERYKNIKDIDVSKYSWKSVAEEWLDTFPKFM